MDLNICICGHLCKLGCLLFLNYCRWMCIGCISYKKCFFFFFCIWSWDICLSCPCSGLMTLFYLYKLATGGNHIPAKADWWQRGYVFLTIIHICGWPACLRWLRYIVVLVYLVISEYGTQIVVVAVVVLCRRIGHSCIILEAAPFIISFFFFWM